MSDIIRSEEHNGYTYDVYDSGTTIARGNTQDDKASRNTYIQRNAGGDSRRPDDHGGHLVPADDQDLPGVFRFGDLKMGVLLMRDIGVNGAPEVLA